MKPRPPKRRRRRVGCRGRSPGGLDVEGHRLSEEAQAERIQRNRLRESKRLEGDAVEAGTECVQMSQDVRSVLAGRAWAAASPGADPCLLGAGLSVEGDLDPKRLGEEERLGGGVVSDGAHLEGELLGLPDEGVPGDLDGVSGQETLARSPQGDLATTGPDGAVGTDEDLCSTDGGGREAGEGEDVFLLRPDDSGVTSDVTVQERALKWQSGGA